MTTRGKWAIALLCTAVVLLGGCSQEDQSAWSPQEPDAISVSSDGSVKEIVQESLEEAYYDADELNDMIISSVEAYNQEHGEDAVVVERYEAEDREVTLELLYASGADFAAFNNVEYFQGSIISAQLEGYLFDVSFYRVKDGEPGETAVDSSTVFQDMSAEVLIVQAPLEVHIDGKVKFISTNAGMISESTVRADGQTGELSYEEQKAANRVYIIYQ